MFDENLDAQKTEGKGIETVKGTNPNTPTA